MTITRKANRILKKAIAALPMSVTLSYVAYNDQMEDKQVAQLLGGEYDNVVEEISENLYEHEDYNIDAILEEVLDDDEAEYLKDSEAFVDFVDECRERDNSDYFADLVKNTHRKMVRVHIKQDGKNVALDSGSYCFDFERVQNEARKLAEAAGVNFVENRDAFVELVLNATYGGDLCVLYYADVASLAEAVNHTLSGYEKGRVRMTFTDPTLLIHDRYNGTGHDVEVKGKVMVEFGKDDLGYPYGVLELDHKGAGTGYSWSDDIAGVVYSAFENHPEIQLI